jgi:hypothetical protein
MAVRTVRFNKEEESKLKVILAYYNSDFSTCVKELFADKLEDLQDIGVIKKIKEGKKEDYLTAGEIDKLFAA